MGAFTKLFSRLKLTSDPAVTTQTATVIQADSTNSSLVIAPNGTGALVAQIPDGTVTGGNLRGTYSVDFQRNRQINTQVASGVYSTIGGGFSNTSSSNYSTVGGGYRNDATLDHSTVAGGYDNNATADSSSIGGGYGNNASSFGSTISGGQSNTASTNTHATVVGGQNNTASGQRSIAGGAASVASNTSTVSLGGNNNATGIGSVAIGRSCTANAESGVSIGYQNTASAKYSNASGLGAIAYLQGMQTFSTNGGFVGNGEAQLSNLVPMRSASLTTGGTTVLSLDGTGVTNLIIPSGNNRAWNVQIDTIAVVTAITGTATGVTVGDCYMQKDCLLFKRIGGTSSIVGSIDTTSIKNDTSMATCAIDINSGASQQLEIVFNAPLFSGGGSVTFRIVSKVALVEVAY